MNRRRKTLPAVPGNIPSDLRPLLSAIKEVLETGEGVRGDTLDQKPTYRDLLDVGVLKFRIPGQGASGGIDAATPLPDMTVPPRPTGFNAVGGFYGIITLTWDVPQQRYNNHAYTNIYRSEDDNFANAQLVGRDAGFVYSDKVRNDQIPNDIAGYYYWITFTSEANIEGPPNSPDGTYAEPLPDLGLLLEQLSGKLSESELSQALNTRINASEILGQQNAAAIQQESIIRSEADSILASQVNTVATQVSGNTAAIQQQATTINGLSAQYTLKLDVNGYVSGFGAYNDGATADFAVLADRFYIARPGANNSKVMPFIVDNGVVYINTAFIKEASIQQGQLGPINFGKIVDAGGSPVTNVAGKLRVENIDVENLQVGNQQISGVIQSNQTGANGLPRWRLDKNGGMELNGVAGGGRMEVRDNVIKVFDGSGRLRVQIGNLTV